MLAPPAWIDRVIMDFHRFPTTKTGEMKKRLAKSRKAAIRK
jgi:hypothetical protein